MSIVNKIINKVSSLDGILFSISSMFGAAETGLKPDYLTNLEYFTNPIFFTVVAGAITTLNYGIQEGIRRGTVVYGSYLFGMTSVEIVKYLS